MSFVGCRLGKRSLHNDYGEDSVNKYRSNVGKLIY